MPTVEYPKNPNSDTVFVTDDNGKRTRSLKKVLVDGTIDYPVGANSTSCYVTIDGKKQRALMTADITSEGTVEYADGSNSTKGYVTDGDGNKHRVVLTATIAGGGAPINNQDISVTANGTYTADEGYTGLGTVSVSVPNPSTGTKSITANGVYDVTNFASADVQVPTTAPTYYIEKNVVSGKLVGNSSNIMTTTGATDIGDGVFAFAYTDLSSGNINLDFSSLTQVSGNYAFYNMFGTGLVARDIVKSVDLSNLTSVTGQNSFYSFLKAQGGLTGKLDLSKLTTVTAQNAFYSAFSSTGITEVDLSKLENISGNAVFQDCFSNCGSLTKIDLSSFKVLGSTSNSAFSSAFSGCSNLTDINLSNLSFVSAQSGFYQTFRNNTSLTTINLGNLIDANGGNCFQNMFSGCSALTTVNLGKLTRVRQGNSLYGTFQNCISLTELSFPSLLYTTDNFNASLQNMLSGCSGVTVHFPAEWQTAMSSWSNVTNGFGGTNTTVLFDLPNKTTLDLSNITSLDKNWEQSVLYQFAINNRFPNITKVDLSNLTVIDSFNVCAQAFEGCTGLTSIDLSSLETVGSGCGSMFKGCTGLTSVDLSSLKTITGTFASVFYGCTGLTSVDLSGLETMPNSGSSMSYAFYNCSSLTSVTFTSLNYIKGNNAFGYCFAGSGITSLSFPALKTTSFDSYTSIFANMINGLSGVTIHFPSNLDPQGGSTIITTLTGYPNFGGTNTTLSFDLPATE